MRSETGLGARPCRILLGMLKTLDVYPGYSKVSWGGEEGAARVEHGRPLRWLFLYHPYDRFFRVKC